MDLKLYYQKVRDTEAEIAERFPWLSAKRRRTAARMASTTEVTRAIAAKMIVEGTARLATADEAKATAKRKPKPGESRIRRRRRPKCNLRLSRQAKWRS